MSDSPLVRGTERWYRRKLAGGHVWATLEPAPSEHLPPVPVWEVVQACLRQSAVGWHCKKPVQSWRGTTFRFEDLTVGPGSVIFAPPLIACVKLYTCTSVPVFRSFQIEESASKADFHFASCLETASELYFSVHHLPREWGRKLEVHVRVPFRYVYGESTTGWSSVLMQHSNLLECASRQYSCLFRQIAQGW